MTASEEQDMSKRWNQLRQTGPAENVQRMNPVIGSKGKVPAGDQATIPQFFNIGGSIKMPQFVNPDVSQNAVPESVTLPMSIAPMNINTFPRRITPIPVIPQGGGA